MITSSARNYTRQDINIIIFNRENCKPYVYVEFSQDGRNLQKQNVA